MDTRKLNNFGDKDKNCLIFDKTDHLVRKSIFYDETTKQLSLRISQLVLDKLKIFVGGENSRFDHFEDKKLPELKKNVQILS